MFYDTVYVICGSKFPFFLKFQIEGNFKLNVPPMILGYNTQTQSNDEYGVIPSVYLLLSLEPTLNQSPLLKKKVHMYHTYTYICIYMVLHSLNIIYLRTCILYSLINCNHHCFVGTPKTACSWVNVSDSIFSQSFTICCQNI